MTEESSRLSRLRDQYRATRPHHRPVPVVMPFVIITVLAALAFLFLDPLAGGMYGHWPSWLANNAAHVTDVGRSWWILSLSVVLIVGAYAASRISRSERMALVTARVIAIASYLLVSVGLAALIVNIAKRAIGRPRPVMFSEQGLFSINSFTWNFDYESFPSGHSTVNGALFMALALLFPRFRWPLLALGLAFALTRVFVGAHYPSDVTVGFGFGMWFSFMTALFLARFGLLFDTADGRLRVKT